MNPWYPAYIQNAYKKIIALEIQIFLLSEIEIQLLKKEYEKKWSTYTEFPDASQTMPDKRKSIFSIPWRWAAEEDFA